MIIGNLFQQLYTMTDSVIVGQAVGESALAAVGASYALTNVFISIAIGGGVGASVLTSQAFGRRDYHRMKRFISTALFTFLAVSLLLGGFGLAFSGQIMAWLRTPASILVDAAVYLNIYFLGLPFLFMYNVLSAMFNALGRSKVPLYLLIFSSVLNVGLDLYLVLTLKMGVAGAAIATDISQLVSCVLSLRFLMKVDADYKVELSSVRPDKRMTSRIIRIGLPTGIQNMVISFSNVLVQSSVNSYGAAAMAGFAAYMKIDGFNILPVTSFSMAATTFVGQNYGAGNLKRVKKGTWVTLAMGVLYTLCTGALLLAFQKPIMHLFTSDETVVSFGCIAMHYFCPFYFLLSILHGMAGAVRGTGRSVPPMVVLLVSLCLFRVVWIQFVLPFFSGIEGVFVLYPVSWALGAALMVLYAWKGSWMTYDHS